MFEEVLDRENILAFLRQMREQLETEEGDGPRRYGSEPEAELAPEDRAALLSALAVTEAREQATPSGQAAQRGFLSSLLDKRSFFSRDPVISLIQSRLEECLIKHQPAFGDLAEVAVRDEASQTDESDPVGAIRATADLRRYGPFEPCDVGWVAAGVAWGLRAFRGKHRFNPEPAPAAPLAERSRLLLVSDWATGLPRARKVADQMRNVLDEGRAGGLEQHVVHLGDVYYAGLQREVEANMLDLWPVDADQQPETASWALAGNHDLYSGGKPYYEVLLGDSRFQRHHASSFFSLVNGEWQVLGLDTAWDDHALKDPQSTWLAGLLDEADRSGRKTVLLSHHQLFSARDTIPPGLPEKIEPALNGRQLFAWFWGHEHRCAAYKPDPRIRHARCIGNSGVPAYIDEGPPKNPDILAWEFGDYIAFNDERWLLFAFAVLDFDGAALRVRYIDENGRTFQSEDLI